MSKGISCIYIELRDTVCATKGGSPIFKVKFVAFSIAKRYPVTCAIFFWAVEFLVFLSVVGGGGCVG